MRRTQADLQRIERTPVVVAVSGASGAGKTTLIEALVPALVARGLRVVTLKHAHCLAELDTIGKDTWRHRRAGAARVVLEGRGMRAVFEPSPEGRASPDLLAARFAADADVVIAEGFRQERMARIEVVVPGDEPVLAPRGAGAGSLYYRAVVAQPDVRGIPQWGPALVRELADDLVRRFAIEARPSSRANGAHRTPCRRSAGRGGRAG